MPRARRGAAPPTPAAPSGRRGGRKGHLPACMGHRNAHRPPAARTAPPLGAAPSKGRADRATSVFFCVAAFGRGAARRRARPDGTCPSGGFKGPNPPHGAREGLRAAHRLVGGKGDQLRGGQTNSCVAPGPASQPEARADGGAFMRGDRSCAGDAQLPAKRGLRQEYADPLAPRQRHAKLLAGAAHGGRLSLTAAVEARALRSNRNPRLPADCFLLTWTPTAPRRAGQRHDQARRG